MKIMKTLAIFLFCLPWFGLGAQELVVSNTANLQISSNATLILANGMSLVNNSSAGMLNGTFVFRGTLPQDISGEQPVTLETLKIEDGAFVNLKNNVTVNSELNLTNGIINLLDNNLKISDDGSISGSFSETSMVVAEGEGTLQRELTENGTYFFPIGDTSNVDEYSPASFEFYSTDFSNGLLSVNLKNMKHPNNTSNSNYLNRYWGVKQTGLSNINCTVTFTYTNDDIVGSEASMVGSYWNGSWWTPFDELSMNEIFGAVYGFGDFTGGELDALNVEENETDKIQILVEGNIIRLNSNGSFQINKIEVFNKLGQFYAGYQPANASNFSFNLSEKPDIYLVRVTSKDQVVVKKVVVN
jgi:hypothetical protein